MAAAAGFLGSRRGERGRPDDACQVQGGLQAVQEVRCVRRRQAQMKGAARRQADRRSEVASPHADRALDGEVEAAGVDFGFESRRQSFAVARRAGGLVRPQAPVDTDQQGSGRRRIGGGGLGRTGGDFAVFRHRGVAPACWHGTCIFR